MMRNDAGQNESCWTAATREFQPTVANMAKLLALITLNAAIIAGNGLVILAVCNRSKLRTINGLLITSLATADLLLGASVLPFSVSKELLASWAFGPIWCKVWLQLDVFLCTASIYNLVAISVDRFLAITKPLAYRVTATKKKGRLMILGVWLVSAAICLPVFFWTAPPSNDITAQILIVENACDCTPMNNEPAYIVYSAFGSFYVPMLLVAGLYAKIYAVARQASTNMSTGYLSGLTVSGTVHSPRIHRGGTTIRKKGMTLDVEKENSPNMPHKLAIKETHSDIMTVVDHQRRVSAAQQIPVRKISEGTDRQYALCHKKSPLIRRTTESAITLASSIGVPTQGWPRLSEKCVSRFTFKPSNALSSYQTQLSAELRAAKTVAVVTGCFFASWIGFAVCYLVNALPWCRQPDVEKCVPDTIFSVVFWMGYANSVLNPAIYSLFNKEFRKAFTELVTCGRRKQKQPRQL